MTKLIIYVEPGIKQNKPFVTGMLKEITLRVANPKKKKKTRLPSNMVST